LAVIIFRMKHHLITGAASGFGFALARTLLSRGDTVMACDINTAPMEQLRAFATASDRLQIRQLNVRDPSQWEQTMQNVVQLWPRIDTVMNVAGVLRPDFIADIQLADGSSGLEAVNELLASFEAPVIFITAYPERFLTGERPEPAFLIAKPFQPATVSAVASQALFFERTAKRRERRVTV